MRYVFFSVYVNDRSKLNKQSLDFGFETVLADSLNVPEMEKNIMKLYTELDSVAITEHFLESMVLMSQKLCFPLYDFTSVPQKKRMSDPVSIEMQIISQTLHSFDKSLLF